MRARTVRQVGPERMLAGGELPGEDAEGENIGARVDVAAAQLFGGHVARRAERGTRFGESASTPSRWRGSAIRARPKSSTLIWPSARRMMFSGFRSRWTMPRSCAAASAAAMCDERADAAAPAGAVRPRAPRASVSPAHQLGDDVQLAVDLLEREDRGNRRDATSAAAARASRVSRSRRDGSRVYSGVSALSATVRREPRVLGRIDDAHAAAADFVDHAVVADAAARSATARHRRASDPAATPQAGSSRKPPRL